MKTVTTRLRCDYCGVGVLIPGQACTTCGTNPDVEWTELALDLARLARAEE